MAWSSAESCVSSSLFGPVHPERTTANATNATHHRIRGRSPRFGFNVARACLAWKANVCPEPLRCLRRVSFEMPPPKPRMRRAWPGASKRWAPRTLHRSPQMVAPKRVKGQPQRDDNSQTRSVAFVPGKAALTCSNSRHV